MIHKVLAATAAIAVAASANASPAPKKAGATVSAALPASSPFAKPSSLPFQAPDFSPARGAQRLHLFEREAVRPREVSSRPSGGSEPQPRASKAARRSIQAVHPRRRGTVAHQAGSAQGDEQATQHAADRFRPEAA